MTLITRRLFIGLLGAILTVSSVQAGGHLNPKKDAKGNFIRPTDGDAPRDVILVAGGTGRVGRLLVRQLQGLDQDVRVLARSEKRAREVLPHDTKFFVGDVTKPETLPAAFEGVTLLVTTIGAGGRAKGSNSAETVDYMGTAALVEAAKIAGVTRIVQVSSMGVTQPDHFLNKMFNGMLTWKLKGENSIRESGIAYTIIRPGGLAAGPGGKRGIQFLQGDAPIKKGEIPGKITRADVAIVVVQALFGENTTNKTIEIVQDNDASSQIKWPKVWKKLKAD